MSPIMRLLSSSSASLPPLSLVNGRMHLIRDREKAENALFEHVRKAVNSQETAPKQKHVRGKQNDIVSFFLTVGRMYCFCLG